MTVGGGRRVSSACFSFIW